MSHYEAERAGMIIPVPVLDLIAAAAAESGRDAIGIDLDPRNLDLARQRIGLFLDETPPTPTERATP